MFGIIQKRMMIVVLIAITLLVPSLASAAFTEFQLTTSTSDDQHFVISPDGTKIAFSSGRSGADEIWVMNADGSEQTKLTNLGKSYNPVWSPNGNEIAFGRSFPDGWSVDVWKVSADGSDVTQLTDTPGHQADPKFSPDGTKITYESGSGGWAHVWIMNSDGTSQTPLATDHPMDIYGSLSPDGKKISYEYCSNYYMPTSLAIMNPDGSGKTTIKSTPNAYQGFQAWSPDSSKIVFALSSNPTPTYNFESRGVYIINIDGSGYAKIANGDITGQRQSWQNQVWSPDGSKIVYFSKDSGNFDVWMMNQDGTGKEQLTTNSGEDTNPIFSPDGKRVIFQTNRNGNLDIYAIELTTPPSKTPTPTATPLPTTSTPTAIPVTTTPAPTATPIPCSTSTSSVNLHGEKTDVIIGENVLLKLSAINIIGNPIMHVQVIIIPPNGWSVTSSEFSKSGAGQYVTMYDLKPVDGSRDIEVNIIPNQIGDNFEVKGRIIYYLGDNLSTKEDCTLNLPIKVGPVPTITPTNVPGFAFLFGLLGLAVAMPFIKRK